MGLAAVTMASVIVRQGQLEKQAGKSFMGMAPWRDRWVVLTNDELTYYASNKAGEEVRGTHPLSNIRGAVENTKKRPWGFRLETADGKDQWEVGCGSKEDRDGWIQAINTTVHGNHADGALQHSPSMIEGNAFGNKVTKEDFELVGVIGQGSFAKVVEVQKIDTGKTFAMKVLKKKTVVERGQVDHTMSERAAAAVPGPSFHRQPALRLPNTRQAILCTGLLPRWRALLSSEAARKVLSEPDQTIRW